MIHNPIVLVLVGLQQGTRVEIGGVSPSGDTTRANCGDGAAHEQIAKVHNSSISAVALAWLRAQRNVSVPIASARTPEQLTELMKIVELSPKELASIDALSAATI